MVIGSFSTFAQNPSYEEETQTEKASSKKVTTISLFILSGFVALGFSFWAANRYMRSTVEKTVEVEVENPDIVKRYQKARLFLLNVFETYREATKMGIQDSKGFHDIYKKLVVEDDALTRNPSNAQMESFVNSFDAVEKELREALSVITDEYNIYKHAKASLAALDSATGYTKAYADISGDPFKPIISSKEEYAQLLDKYFYLVEEHLSLRNELTDYITNLRAQHVKSILKSLLKNVEYIKSTQADIINFQTNEKRNLVHAENGKVLIRKRAESLLSYCDESSATKQECDEARAIIEEVLEASIDFKADDAVTNYGLYRTLLRRLDDASIPYKKHQELNKQAAYSSKGDVGKPTLTNVSIGYGLGDMKI